MFGIGFTEILLILVVALIVIGPSKLPEFARTAGKGVRSFQDALNGIKQEVMSSEVHEENGRKTESNIKTTPQQQERKTRKLTERGPGYYGAYRPNSSEKPIKESINKGNREHADKKNHPLP